ncbi:hypothetical protein AMS68_006097 [Peltaster fructicola]|uniref:Prenylcysteine lyase domain-containing protein n=1 Tax=Peltaster fructicola TaxID=286661 RepID=A0A6H0Y1Q2_9PEZI|nr:hypothetical protein AMS68_006097 [Peltaster fructicola]
MRPMICLLSILGSAGLCNSQAQQVVLASYNSSRPPSSLSVAIIGAGAAGSSTAYHLSRFAAEANLAINITILERNSYVGGRSTTINAYDDPGYPLELGASIFVKVNHILVDAARTFNLTTSSFATAQIAGDRAPSLGIWDGNKFVITLSSSGATWWDTAKFLLRYGLAPIRTMRLMRTTVGKFLTMYDEPIFPFTSLTEAADNVDLLGVTSIPGTRYLFDNGISASFAHDVIQASTRVNYAQNLELFHGLETMVCMATDGAMAIQGGNWQIFDHFITASDANLLLNATAHSISRELDGTFTIQMASKSSQDCRTTSENFDAVVIAAPFEGSKISLGDMIHKPGPVGYVNLHVTIFTSPHRLSPGFFGLNGNDDVPRTVLTTLLCDDAPETCFSVDGTAPDFFSISLLTAVQNPGTGSTEYAYKVFSHTAPSDRWLQDMLSTAEGAAENPITWIHRKLWQSYPLETPKDTFELIQLHDKLWYTGGMDSFISTMETNALMGKNVAKLVVEELQSHNDSQRPRLRDSEWPLKDRRQTSFCNSTV